METLLFPLLILLLFIPIFLSGRKQRRQMQETQRLQAALEVGDVVTTTSGLRATVVDASYEDTIDLEIADGVVTTWLRAAVRDKVDTTPDDASELTGDDVIPSAPAEPTSPSLEKNTDATPTGGAASNGTAGTSTNGTAGSTDDDAQTGGTPGSRN
ncbi:MAG: preprotein translocase subunit YajC [Pseudonocardia sp.]|uniref:preprotein translocase subunit YajC n=1 Tax=unclassified Pseudonocardia TaxID=2619320 RepID=UPI00086ABAE2|nr:MULTISPECIES: preprotein translocase subunit YajC [unclassified Pseudonocardia]MBN9112791.1 preprotein translocase subunit YajC [Pseudonocardia sp.]ODV00371.1 MAG: preprotein translocase subunit YajC [Pseudonocardia sp. SCN 73-27]